MTGASLSSEKVGAANVDSMLDHCEKKRFLKKSFSLAVVDGHQRRSCIQILLRLDRLASSGLCILFR